MSRTEERNSTSSNKLAWRWGAVVLAVAGLAESGCSEFNVKPMAIGDTKVLATKADIRLITERVRARKDDEGPKKILCAEPSPDVALALSRALTADAHATTPGGVSAGLTGGYSMSEAALALAGRTSAVVALRDGLFRACEAYSNHIIEEDEYALILSQYGDLLVALVLGDTGAAAAGMQTTVTSTSTVTPPAPAAAAGGAANPGAGANAGGTPAAGAVAPPVAPAATGVNYRPDTATPKLIWASAHLATQKKPVKKPAKTPAKTTKTPAKVLTPTHAPVTNTNTTTTATTPTPAASPAEAIAKAYFAASEDRLTKAMFTVCVHEASRHREEKTPVLFPQAGNEAPYFDRLCSDFLTKYESPPATPAGR